MSRLKLSTVTSTPYNRRRFIITSAIVLADNNGTDTSLQGCPLAQAGRRKGTSKPGKRDPGPDSGASAGAMGQRFFGERRFALLRISARKPCHAARPLHMQDPPGESLWGLGPR